MSDVAEPRMARLAGILAVLLFLAFAVAGPVVIVRERLGADTGSGAAAAEEGGAAGGGITAFGLATGVLAAFLGGIGLSAFALRGRRRGGSGAG